jgi:hypothetical protein
VSIIIQGEYPHGNILVLFKTPALAGIKSDEILLNFGLR